MALTEAMIERRLQDFVDRWLATYLRLQCEVEGRDPAKIVVPPAALRYDPERRFAEQDLPVIVVDLPAPGSAQAGRSRGTWDVWQPVQVGVITAGDSQTARDDAGTYLGALREMFITQQSLDGLAGGVRYVADGLDDAPVGQSRYMAFGELDVLVLLRGIADRGHVAAIDPPTQPDPQPDPDVPISGFDHVTDAREPS